LQKEADMGVTFWISAGSFGVIFLGAMVVEQWMMARKRHRTNKSVSASDQTPPGAESPE
jgi:hypothetical protein